MRSAARARTAIAPIVFGLLVLALWQLLVLGLRIQPFVLPGPVAIGQQFGLRSPFILQAAVITALNALVGLAIGTVVAVVGAVLAAAVRVLDELSTWIVTALSVVPIVALAPVLYTMFGASVQTARVLIAAIAVFVPVYVTTLRGLRTVLPIHRDLMRAYAATSWQATRAVTLPGAIPYFFTGLRIASSLAVISALVAEYFGGPFTGLGKSITSAVSSSNFPLAWAFVLGAILTGLVFYLVTLALEVVATRHR
ncbi:ABC transporter permease [Pseudolysinimonas sp.]|uniref:ABC transporter permease n=1 Tax=Pseudolysinimonas sp. TaxID=2680009 RepID=UPI003F7CD52B